MIKELIAQGESSRLEFKSTIDSSIKIAKTLAAFANTSGGILLIGIQDNGGIKGIGSELQEMEKIEEAALFLCHPPIPISYESKVCEGKRVLLIRIDESFNKPHTLTEAEGTHVVYIRVRDKSVPAGKKTSDMLTTVQTTVNPELLRTGHVKSLLTFLQKNKVITGKQLARLINISERRAIRLLRELTRQDILLLNHQPHAITYSLK